MPALLLVPLALLIVAGAAWIVLWRRYRVQRHHAHLAQRIRDRFPVLDEPIDEDAVPLHSPPGEVAVRSDGIHLRLATPGFGHCRVPWSDINHVLPTGQGVRVHIEGVGDLRVPSSAGRKIWSAISEARSASQAGA